jgi:hypothetical protein
MYVALGPCLARERDKTSSHSCDLCPSAQGFSFSIGESARIPMRATMTNRSGQPLPEGSLVVVQTTLTKRHELHLPGLAHDASFSVELDLTVRGRDHPPLPSSRSRLVT